MLPIRQTVFVPECCVIAIVFIITRSFQHVVSLKIAFFLFFFVFFLFVPVYSVVFVNRAIFIHARVYYSVRITRRFLYLSTVRAKSCRTIFLLPRGTGVGSCLAHGPRQVGTR